MNVTHHVVERVEFDRWCFREGSSCPNDGFTRQFICSDFVGNLRDLVGRSVTGVVTFIEESIDIMNRARFGNLHSGSQDDQAVDRAVLERGLPAGCPRPSRPLPSPWGACHRNSAHPEWRA
jgi:hypothetical protein